MKKTNKILSVLLAVVMLFSAMSVSLCASAFTAKPEGLWADPAAGFTQATVTNGTNTANTANAKVILDFLDEVLKGVDLSGAQDVLDVVNKIPGLKIDLSNGVDGLLGTIDSVANVNGTVLTRTIIASVLGYAINTNKWTKGQTRAKTGDVAILNNLLAFLADNQTFLGAFVANKTKQVNIETVLGKDIKTYVKELVAKAIYDYEKDASLKSKYDAAVKKTLDDILLVDGLGYGLNGLLKQGDDALKAMDNEVINDLYSWGFKLEGLLDGFKYNDKLTLDATIAQIFGIVYNANKTYIQKLLYTHGAELQAAITSNEYGAPFASLLKFDKFTEGSDYSFLNLSSFTSIKDFNKLLGQFVKGVSTYTAWDNAKNLGYNFTEFVKWALNSIDKTDTPYEGYDFNGSNEAVALALAKMIVNIVVTDDDVKATLNKCTTTKQVVTKLVPQLCKANEAIVISSKSTTWEQVLGDIVGSFLADYAVLYTNTTNTARYTKGSSKGIWDVLNYAANYYLVDLNFDTLFGLSLTKSQTFLQKLDALQAKVMGDLQYSKFSTLIPKLLDAVFALDLNTVVGEGVEKAFTNINTSVSAANLAYKIINNVLSAITGNTVFAGSFTTLDNILSPATLEGAVKNLIAGLNERKADLLPVILFVFSAIDEESTFAVTFGKDGAVTVKYAGKALTKDKDYTVSTAINVKGKSSKVTVTGKGNYAGKVTGVSACSKHSYGTAKVTKAATTSKAGTLTYTCKLCGATKTAAINYAKSFKLSKTVYTYTGKALKPTVTVKDSKGNTLKNGTDYTVKYSNNTNPGKATVTITLKGKYTGTKKLTFTINPKATTMGKVTAASKGFTANWKKQATQTTGYEIQYSTSKKFEAKKTKTIKVTSAKTVSKKVTKLKAKTTYYVRVRTYKTVSKVNYYSDWSKAVSVKTK